MYEAIVNAHAYQAEKNKTESGMLVPKIFS